MATKLFCLRRNLHENLEANFSLFQVWNVIGRSIVVTECEDDLGKGTDLQSKIDGNSGQRLKIYII